MNLAVLADEGLKQEFLNKVIPESGITINFCDSVKTLTMVDADAYFDLQFRMDKERTDQLSNIKNKPVFINSIAHTSSVVGNRFIRINAWPGLLKRNRTEIAVAGSEQLEEALQVFEKLIRKGVPVRRLGSAAIDLCWVAAGRFDGFYEHKLQAWDSAAGFLIVEEAGGKVTDFKGDHYSPYQPHIIATNGKIHEQLVKVVNGGNVEVEVQKQSTKYEVRST